MKALLEKTLFRYSNKPVSVRLKARFFLIICLTIIILMPLILIYTVLLHRNNPIYDYTVNYNVVMPLVLAFILIILITIILIKGKFKAAAHSILFVAFSAIWLVMFADRSAVISRLDTIVYVAAFMTMLPLVVSRRAAPAWIYGIANIIMLYIFMFYFRNELDIPVNSFIDYLADNTIALTFIMIVSYNIININNTSLDIAENLNLELSRKNTDFEASNEELQSAIEELEETNEAFEAQNEELISSRNQLLQAQKMEAIGTMAGGIAHDFNNILTGIMGSLEIMDYMIKSDEGDMKNGLIEYIETARESAVRAAGITKQLLALSRKAEPDKNLVDISLSLKAIHEICKNSLPKTVTLDFNIPEESIYIFVDRSRIEQMLLNLCLNASHSMTLMRHEEERQGGTLAVRASISECPPKISGVDNEEIQKSRSYLRIDISDDGVGIDPEIQKLIFEPFYTTKKNHDGSGLGLTMAYGIVEQHDGFIDLASNPGHGTLFSVYLPLDHGTGDTLKEPVVDKELIPGEGLVLIVDDEKTVLKVTEGILRICGYTTLTASSGREALSVFETNRGSLKAVVLDYSMPDMNGLEVMEKIRSFDPEVEILIVSGFMDVEVTGKARDLGASGIIQKPFSASDLSSRVKKLFVRQA